MLELTDKNHFAFGYNGTPFTFRQSAIESWYCKYGACYRPPFDFGRECIETAKKIAAATSKRIYLLFSGGLDSEVMVRAFQQSGADFTVCIIRFKFDLNVHDISYAVLTCEELGIPYQFFDVDIEQFFNSKLALHYGLGSQCITPQLIPPMLLMDQLDGYCVLGSGDCYFVHSQQIPLVGNYSRYSYSNSNPVPGWELWEKEKVASWYRFLIWQNKPGCAGFFQYTPEIMAAYLLDPVVQQYMQNSKTAVSTAECKWQMYSQHFPVRPRTKYTGYEKAPLSGQLLREKLESQFRANNAVYRTPLGLLEKALFGRLPLERPNALA